MSIVNGPPAITFPLAAQGNYARLYVQGFIGPTGSLIRTGTGAIGSAGVSVTIVDPPPSTGGCSSGGPTGFAAALFGVLLATRLLRRRHGAQPCAALESNIVSE